MKRLIKKASDFDVNSALYVEGSIESEEFILKEEVVEFILDSMEYDGDSSFSAGIKSNDWYVPDDPAEVYLTVEGKLPISRLEEQYGKLGADDFDMIQQDLTENDHSSDMFQEIADDFKAPEITSFTTNFKVTVNSNEILVEIEADDIEIEELTYDDYHNY